LMLFTISASGSGALPGGTHKATFAGIEPTETSRGEALRWRWTLENGTEYAAFSDRNPTTKNKVGRWLAALSGKAATEGVSVNPDDYVGRPYLLIVEQGDNGSTRLNTFTAC